MSTIIFGPTGNVASSLALSAANHPSLQPLVLAMRDPSKPIPHLPPSLESSSDMRRIRADLSDPSSVLSAVRSSSAKRAFLYLARDSTDHMRGTIEALRAGGVEFVVYLSSAGVHDAVDEADPVRYRHAVVERNLREVFGPEGYVAMRPGMFASNAVMWWKGGIAKGEVRLYAGDFRADWIAPGDIGAVAAAVLARGGLEGGGCVLDLLGPEDMSFRDVIKVLAKVAGKDVRIVDADAGEGIKEFMALGLPEPVAAHVIQFLGEGLEKGGVKVMLQDVVYEAAVANVERYKGKPAMRFAEWAEENRGDIVG
ncbi:hypothetical protein QBC47DRAFT_423738 [Echria macrotheca]|uniref:NAD(P)-binding domain-containing protein n=1 Tax=Echria macrotheca TaxID=438768 RepID=A0AAJ0B8Z2_9PEZI|nr:hypothetical protein QBC47DRAFT_423738 [Echria macrotheca]